MNFIKILVSSSIIIAICHFYLDTNIYASAPSKFVTQPKFYSKDFEHKTGMQYVSTEMTIGILDDEVFIGRPRVYVNDRIVLCDECESEHTQCEAVSISFKKNRISAKCDKHSVTIEPINQEKYKTIDIKDIKSSSISKK